MRKIKFRGKAKNGKWYFGFLFGSADNYRRFIQWKDNYGNLRKIGIDPKTIGQFTGFHDGLDGAIYEGDILQFEGHDEIFMNVVFNNGAWYVTTLNNKKNDRIYELLFDTLAESIVECAPLKIVGNVHDNSELLEA